MTGLLAIEHVYKIFGDEPDKALDLAQDGVEQREIFRRTGSVVAVNDASFTVPKGDIFVVMGLSGSGKSTLIRCINRLIDPTEGRITLDGEDITAASPAELREVRLRRMGMVFQHFALLPHKSVAENVEYGLKARGVGRQERREKALAALKRVGLDPWADAFPSSLSGGMQQRVGLARGLAVEPEVLLMDEPFSALDPLIRRDIQDELLVLQDELKTTIVFITHDLQEALKLGDQIAIMKEGRFVQTGSPQDIVISPAEDYVFEFTRDVDRSRVLTFGRIMTPAETVAPDAKAGQLRRRLCDGGSLFVVDEAGRPLGIIDANRLDNVPDQHKANDVMDETFSRVEVDWHIHEAFDRLGTHRPVAVVGQSGELVGIVDPPAVFAMLKPAEHKPTKEAQPQPS